MFAILVEGKVCALQLRTSEGGHFEGAISAHIGGQIGLASKAAFGPNDLAKMKWDCANSNSECEQAFLRFCSSGSWQYDAVCKSPCRPGEVVRIKTNSIQTTCDALWDEMKRASNYLQESLNMPSSPSMMVTTKVFVVPYFPGVNTGSHSLFAFALSGESSLTVLSIVCRL